MVIFYSYVSLPEGTNQIRSEHVLLVPCSQMAPEPCWSPSTQHAVAIQLPKDLAHIAWEHWEHKHDLGYPLVYPLVEQLDTSFAPLKHHYLFYLFCCMPHVHTRTGLHVKDEPPEIMFTAGNPPKLGPVRLIRWQERTPDRNGWWIIPTKSYYRGLYYTIVIQLYCLVHKLVIYE